MQYSRSIETTRLGVYCYFERHYSVQFIPPFASKLEPCANCARDHYTMYSIYVGLLLPLILDAGGTFAALESAGTQHATNYSAHLRRMDGWMFNLIVWTDRRLTTQKRHKCNFRSRSYGVVSDPGSLGKIEICKGCFWDCLELHEVDRCTFVGSAKCIRKKVLMHSAYNIRCTNFDSQDPDIAVDGD
jgi:hypothetical protein